MKYMTHYIKQSHHLDQLHTPLAYISVMLCSREGNRRPDIALAMRHRL